MSGGLVPSIDFTPLSRLGDTLAKGMRERERRDALTTLGVSPGDPNFLPKLGQTLVGLGDIEGALTVSRLQEAAQDRTYQRGRDARQDAFQERAFSVGRQDVTENRARQHRLDTRQQGQDQLTNYYREKNEQRADAQLDIQRRAATQREIPAGFEQDPAGNGFRPIANGPADPSYIEKRKAAENSTKGGQNLNPYAPNGGSFNESQGKSAVFADRMFENERLIQLPPGSYKPDPKAPTARAPRLEEIGTSRFEQGLESRGVPGFVGSYLHSEDFRSYKAAKDNWIAAQLRKESGAAINQDEYAQADKQYFPQPGDSARQIEEKRQRRRIATEGMAREGGGSYQPRYQFGEGNAVVERPATVPQAPATAAPAPAQGNPRLVPMDQVPEGARFRRDGRIYRRVNGQDVPE